jgi:nicotinamide-nucleotide amidase
MRAVVLSIGSELLQGYLTDTNATFLAQELSGLGIELVGVSQVDDNFERVVRAFKRALGDAELVVATGGIGPTDDDLTREAIAEVVCEQPRVDEDLANAIREFFVRRGSVMPEQNIKQAWVIPSSEALLNPMGTAPGWFVEHDNRVIVAMPGVPREMSRMWREQAVPRILKRLGSHAIVATTLKTIGIGESAVEHEIHDVIRRGHPVVATYAKDDGVHIRITSRSENPEVAASDVAQTVAEIRSRIGPYIYGDLNTPISSAILQPIARQGAHIAVLEAGNAGRLAMLLGESPLAAQALAVCSSLTYEVACEGRVEVAPLTLAKHLALRALESSSVDYAAAVAVAMKPGESDDRSTGQIGIAFASTDGVIEREQTVTANPAEIRRRATLSATDLLWTAVRDGIRPHQE